MFHFLVQSGEGFVGVFDISALLTAVRFPGEVLWFLNCSAVTAGGAVVLRYMLLADEFGD